MDDVCKDCGRPGDYSHSEGEYLCDECKNKYVICTACGLLFDEEVASYWTSSNTCIKCDQK